MHVVGTIIAHIQKPRCMRHPGSVAVAPLLLVASAGSHGWGFSNRGPFAVLQALGLTQTSLDRLLDTPLATMSEPDPAK